MISTLLLFSLCVQDDQAVQDALSRFKSAYRSASTTARAAAVAELALTPHEKTLPRMTSLLSGEAKEVRIAAIQGLAAFSEFKKTVTPTLLSALASAAKEPDISAAVLEALGKLKDESALPAVFGKFRGEHIKVATAAVACAGAIGNHDCFQALSELTKDLSKWLKKGHGGGYYDEKGVGEDAAQAARLASLKDALVKALQTLTQEQWSTLQEWEYWFGKHKDDPRFRK